MNDRARKSSWWQSPGTWLLGIGGVLIGTTLFRAQVDKEEAARRALLAHAALLAEADRSRVVGVHLTTNDQWQVVPLTDAQAAFGWFMDMTHGGHRPDPGTFTVWVDKGKQDWRETAFANAMYGRGR